MASLPGIVDDVNFSIFVFLFLSFSYLLIIYEFHTLCQFLYVLVKIIKIRRFGADFAIFFTYLCALFWKAKRFPLSVWKARHKRKLSESVKKTYADNAHKKRKKRNPRLRRAKLRKHNPVSKAQKRYKKRRKRNA